MDMSVVELVASISDVLSIVATRTDSFFGFVGANEVEDGGGSTSDIPIGDDVTADGGPFVEDAANMSVSSSDN